MIIQRYDSVNTESWPRPAAHGRRTERTGEPRSMDGETRDAIIAAYKRGYRNGFENGADVLDMFRTILTDSLGEGEYAPLEDILGAIEKTKELWKDVFEEKTGQKSGDPDLAIAYKKDPDLAIAYKKETSTA
jgi:hypothetical protein